MGIAGIVNSLRRARPFTKKTQLNSSRANTQLTSSRIDVTTNTVQPDVTDSNVINGVDTTIRLPGDILVIVFESLGLRDLVVYRSVSCALF